LLARGYERFCCADLDGEINERLSQLAQGCGLDLSTVSRRIADLEHEGLVAREVDPADRRVYRVKLTAEGQRQFQRMAAEHEQWVIGMFGALGPLQKKQLAALLGELKIQLRAQADSERTPA